jgi:hypothetical protein
MILWFYLYFILYSNVQLLMSSKLWWHISVQNLLSLSLYLLVFFCGYLNTTFNTFTTFCLLTYSCSEYSWNTTHSIWNNNQSIHSEYEIVIFFTGHSVWWTKMIHQTESTFTRPKENHNFLNISLLMAVLYKAFFIVIDFN